MRTIKEVKEWAITRKDGMYGFSSCADCLRLLLEFIDSDPPCKHPRITICNDGIAVFQDENAYAHVKFCPDCGEKLEEKD